MQKVRVCIELEDERYRSLASEADRREVTVSSLVEGMVQGLLKVADFTSGRCSKRSLKVSRC